MLSHVGPNVALVGFRMLQSRPPSADARLEMATIRTTCPHCGEVDMGPESILLSVVQGGREGAYKFTCPDCMDTVEKRADRKIVALLVSAGVDIAVRGTDTLEDADPLVDREPDPRGMPLEGPPFTFDDLIDFHFLLDDDRALETLLADRR
jgi:predicted RNA-binding Zn-ribbon protein involved in translation (DUF1610 family)